MDIFKLFFDHDLRLDRLARRNANKTKEEIEASMADFMKPIPTYSKFYLTGTRLEDDTFGLNRLNKFGSILNQLNQIFDGCQFLAENGSFNLFSEVITEVKTGEAVVVIKSGFTDINPADLRVDYESNVGHFKEELSKVLEDGHIVFYKEQAHDGFDIHLFSKENIYEQFFYAFKKLIDDSFRFFSINSKRMRSEQHFYFETWTLDRPPHGAEEVLPETVL